MASAVSSQQRAPLALRRNADRITPADLGLGGRFAAGDFVEDGRIDLVGLRDGSPFVFEWVGPLVDPDALAAGVGFEIHSYPPRFGKNIALADANDDGHLDVVTRTDAVTLYFGDGSGGWDESVVVDADEPGSVADVRFARLGDGLVHIVSGTRVYLNEGARTIAVGIDLDPTAEALIVGDFDPEVGDELLAIRDDELSLFVLDPEGEWSTRAFDPPRFEGTSPFRWHALVVGDFDGDGDDDDIAFQRYVDQERGCGPDDPF